MDDDKIILERQVWARAGKQVVRKYRCSSGPRKGKVVSDLNKCYANMDTKKRSKMILTKARIGKKMSKKARKTKKVSPLSKQVSSLNQPGRKIK